MSKTETKPEAALVNVFAIVDRAGEVPYRQAVITVQKKQRMEGELVIGETSAMIEPNDSGLYIVDPGLEFAKETIRALVAKQKRENAKGTIKRILGPFTGEDLSEVIEEALKAVVKAQPPSDKVQAAQAKAELATSETEREAERTAAAAKIAELEAALAKK